jgi:hypothetical protein
MSVWAACRGPLAANGLAVIQVAAADGAQVTVTTILTHASGQWLRGAVTANARGPGPQEIGSAVTYLRRYALAAMVGVAAGDDDDAEAAQEDPGPQRGGWGNRGEAPPPDLTVQEEAALADWREQIAVQTDEAGLKRLAVHISKLPQHLRMLIKPHYDAHKAGLAKKGGG